MNLSSGDGWDFVSVWSNYYDGVDYPVLQWEKESGYLNISDDSDSVNVYPNYTKFYANWTSGSGYNRGTPINGTGRYCEFSFNKTGLDWDKYSNSVVNMSYNVTSGLYELIADGGYLAGHRDGMPVGTYYYNISCFDLSGNYPNASLVDIVTVSEYPTNLSVNTTDTTPTTGQMVYFYANYSSPAMRSGIGLNRYEVGAVIWNTSDIDTENSASTNAIAFVDLNNDGKKDDVVVSHGTSYGDRGIYGFYVNGSQKFKMGTYTTSPLEIEVSDLDNDGFENDIVFVSYFGDIIVVNETGDIVWKSDFGGGGYSIVVADLDNDGLKDDFAVGANDGTVYKVMAFNTSDGKNWVNFWNSSQNFTTIIWEVAIGDFDKDGDDDVAAIEGSQGSYGKLQVFVGDNGSLIFKTTSFTSDVRSLTAVDLNHDGFRDEIVIGQDGNIWAYRWNGTYGVELNTTGDEIWKVGQPADSIFEIATIDLDNDGYVDEIIAGDRGSSVGPGYIWAFNETGDYLWNFTLPSAGDDDSINSLVVEDINDDGNAEIIFGSGKFERVYVLNKSGYKLFEYTIGLGGIGNWYGSSPGIDVSDINNDGILDIACTAAFNDSQSYNLTWNNTLRKWQLNRTFASVGTYSYNITCSKGGYQTTTSSSTITVQGNPTGKKFEIKNSTGSTIASIDDVGNMFLKGTKSESQASLTPSANSFILKNSTGSTIVYINESGYLFLLGTVTSGSDMSGLTTTNLEIRNATGSLVAFFDNQGNLKLKGSIYESYANP